MQFVALYSEAKVEPVFGCQKLHPKIGSVDQFFGGSMDHFFGASPSRLGTRPAELLGRKPKVEKKSGRVGRGTGARAYPNGSRRLKAYY